MFHGFSILSDCSLVKCASTHILKRYIIADKLDIDCAGTFYNQSDLLIWTPNQSKSPHS